LDERRRDRRLDSGVELALEVSYQHLPTDQRHLLRLLALHPGPDLDRYAAAALADMELSSTTGQLRQLYCEHLLQRAAPERYALHDLVRAFAAARARDEDSPPARRAALTRLFDFYLVVATAAANRLHPVDAG